MSSTVLVEKSLDAAMRSKTESPNMMATVGGDDNGRGGDLVLSSGPRKCEMPARCHPFVLFIYHEIDINHPGHIRSE